VPWSITGPPCHWETHTLVRVEPLLCNDREIGGYTRAVSGQRLGKHVPTATDTKATREKLFSMWSVSRCYKQGTRLELSSVRESVKRRLELGGRGIATVGAVTWKRLVNILRTKLCALVN
jgi:hypothetical protein